MISRSSTPFIDKRRAAVALTILALAGGGLALRHHVTTANVEAPAADALALRFEPGTTLHYTVSWSGTQRGRLFAESAGAEQTHSTTKVDMALGMDLYVEDQAGDEATLRLSFSKVERHGLTALGAEVFSSREAAVDALVGRSARVRLGTDGIPRDVAFQEGSPDIFMNVVQWIVAQSAVSLGPSERAREWDATERGPFGASSEVHYARSGAELTRSRVRYESFDAFAAENLSRITVKKLDGQSSVRLRDGLVDVVHISESLRIDAKSGGTELDGNVVFDLKLESVDRGDRVGAAVAYGAPAKAGEAVIGADMRAQLLSQRVDGMTREQLLSDLSTMGNGGVMPSHTKWLWRATGLLKKDPSIARELGKLARAPDATDKARALVLDLLASVGHGEAQAEMRTILASPVVAKSGARTSLLQRVSFLESPEPATVDAVWASLREGKQRGAPDLVAASAHSIASSSRAMAKNGDDAGARSMVRRLAAEIEQAHTTESKAAVLSALGNASSGEVTAIAKPYASSESVELREAAADAMRKIDTREATEMLLALLADPSVAVQGAALASLRDRSLIASDWERISELVASGRIPKALDGAMLNLATNYVGQVRVVAQIVAAIASRPDASNATRARAHAMLANVSG